MPYRWLSGLGRDESGAAAIEYALVATLVAVVLIAALAIVGERLSGLMNAAAALL